MADKTNQQDVDEANDDLIEEPTGEAEANVDESGEPNATPEESELSPEQIQELLQTQRRYKELEGEYTRTSQERAELRRQNEQYQRAMAEFMGQKKAESDPVAAARQRWIQAQQTYDPDATAQALDEYIAARENVVAQRAVQQALQAQQLQSAVSRAKKWGVNDANELAALRQNMTAEEEVEALALFKLQKEGRLEEQLGKQAQERRAKAERAKRLNALAGEGSGGRVPGSLDGNEDSGEVNPAQWLAMSPAQRKRVFGDLKPTLD